jgi:hypothetical protein
MRGVNSSNDTSSNDTSSNDASSNDTSSNDTSLNDTSLKMRFNYFVEMINYIPMAYRFVEKYS